jgi:exosortase family protein XrtF
MLNQQRKAIQFIIIFLGVYVFFTIAYQIWLWWLEPSPDAITRTLAQLLSKLFADANYRQLNAQTGYLFIVNQKPVVRIIEGCNGMAVFITLISFCLAFKSNLKSYLWFVPMAFLLLQSANLLRLFVLVHIKLMHPHLFEFFHTYLFPAALYGAAFLLMVWWVKGVSIYETGMIRLTQTRMKIHQASSIRPIKNKLFTDENK